MRFIYFILFISIHFVSQAYWQQKLAYNISVSLDDQKHCLHAFESIKYINNSPDSLASIYMHLWPNAYENNETALAKQLLKKGNTSMYYAGVSDFGKIDSLDFKVNQEKISWSFHPAHSDIAVLILPKVLLPGDSIVISTPFRVKLPSAGISRLGHYQQAYQITQWFPKPAVYDSNGWHPLYYLDQGEFYSEFASFDVQITLPQNYVVASSGNLVGTSSVEERQFMQKRESETRDLLASGFDYKDSFPPSSTEMKTLQYHEENIHDFAWFADKRWLVLSEVVLVPETNQETRVEVLFLPYNRMLWRNALRYAIDGLLFYSKNVGPYPYQHCSVVDGDIAAGGGMEYPNVTIIGEASNAFVLEETIVHEVGHNWFYGILGSNEREYSWMDEGLNSYFERKYIQETRPGGLLSDMVEPLLHQVLKKDDPLQEKYYWYAYVYTASRSKDQATNLNAKDFFGDNYATVVYAKTAVLMNYLALYVEEERLLKAIRVYYEKWKFKHPQPHDFKSVLEAELQLDLSWFFDELLYSNQKMDYGISAIRRSENDDFELLVENKFKVAAPIVIDAMRGDSIVKSFWFEGFKGKSTLLIPNGDYDYLELDHREMTPDLNRENNCIAVQGIFKRFEPFDSRFLFSVPKQNKTQVFYLPFLGYNSNDKLQLGVLLYNSLLQEKRLRYLIMPSFGFGSGRLGGYYKAVYSRYFRNSFFYKLNYSGTYRRQAIASRNRPGYFEKIEPKIQLLGGANSLLKQSFDFRYTFTRINLPGIVPLNNEYLTLNYRAKYKKAIHPFQGEANLQLINYQVLKTWASYHQELNIGFDKNPIEFRIFAGLFLTNAVADLTHRFRATAENGADALVKSSGELFNRGMTDYLMDDIFLARFSSSTNFLSQQIYLQDGGMRTGLYLGANNSWLSSLNVNLPTPNKYLSLYGDLVVYPGASVVEYAYTTGVQLTIIKDVLEFYLPVFNSKNITDNYEVAGLNQYFQKVKFQFNVSQYYGLID